MTQEMLHALIEAIEKPAIFLSADHVICAVNTAYRDTYNIDIQLGESKCFEISHGNDKPCDHYGESCPLQSCANTKQTQRVLHIHKTSSGSNYCDIVMRPVYDSMGELSGYLEVLEDVQYASTKSDGTQLLGNSREFREMLTRVNRAAPSDISIILNGETGTGKELIAAAIHQASKRSQEPFVIVECTGLTETLFESELFGHEKGAFTGATTKKRGLVDAANGGTLFLDEIGDVPLNLQVKLLRLIETGKYRTVGGINSKTADFRLICATHCNLEAKVKNGEFREDLYYRIAAFPIHLPPLRQRLEDLPLLIQHFIHYSDAPEKRFSEAALNTLQHYGFPGNIRELKNIVEHAVLMADDNIIEPRHLPTNVLKTQPSSIDANTTPISDADPLHISPLKTQEAIYLQQILNQYRGSANELAKALGISTRTLYRKLQSHSLRLQEPPNQNNLLTTSDKK